MAGKDEGYTITVDGPDHKFKRAIDETVANKIISFVMTGAALSEGAGSGAATGGSGSHTFATIEMLPI